MSITTFIPKLWSARLIANLNNSLVATNFVNRNYEGEITKNGDTVHINQLTNVTIKAYSKSTAIADPDELTTTDNVLTINQADYFNFKINDIDKAQIKASLVNSAMQTASYGLADKTDKFIFKTIADGANTGNTIGTTALPIALTKTNLYEQIVAMRVLMDKANVPKQGRKLAIPPDAYALLLLDPRFTSSGSEKNTEILATAVVGNVAGFEVSVSNNLPVTTDKHSLVASHSDFTTFADQILSTEAYRLEKGFDDAIKGLHVYGAKVLQPKGIVKLIGTFSG